MKIQRRPLTGTPSGWDPNVPEILQRIYAARGVYTPADVEMRLGLLHSPTKLGSIDKAARIIAEAIVNDQHITIAGDYDCDGATGASVAVRGLRLLGATKVGFIVPNRFKHGYGLSPALVDDMDPATELIVTVDSGVSSVEGVNRAKSKGISVVITDHHLPGDYLPNADAIVNPNLNGDEFPSKMLAGVGVMFYVLLAVRSVLRETGRWGGKDPSLLPLLDLVAIGTVADLVPLDHNNRILVAAGLDRIQRGLANVGVKALIRSAKKDEANFVSTDIAFGIAPRLNAAGRLEDMSLGVQTLITDDPVEAAAFVERLEAINDERKEIQAEMVAEAEQMVLGMNTGDEIGVVVFDPKWHSGIVGLVASRLKENLYLPVIAFAPAGEGSDEVRGSARSIPGFHLRDALALVDVRNPGLIPKFGGHAMAAGLSLKIADVERFKVEFQKVAKELLTEEQLTATVFSDGEIPPGHLNLDFAKYLQRCGPWGQAFPEPVFDNLFYVEDYRVLSDKHLKFELLDPRDGSRVEAIFFNGYKGGEPPDYVRLAYELNINRWKDTERLQLMVRHLEPLE